MMRFISPSMDVTFGRKSLGRGRQLNVVRALGDHAITERHAALEADELSVAYGDLHETARESLAAALHEDVGAPGFHEHRRLGHGRETHLVSRIQDGGTGLSDEQLAPGIVD